LVRFQSKISLKKKEEEHFLYINQNELKIAEGITHNCYDNGQAYSDDHHIYTSDLDIFGEGSIYQMVNRCATLHGNNVLAAWLSHPAEKKEIELRQEFVEELRADFSWWQDLQAKLYGAKDFSLDA